MFGTLDISTSGLIAQRIRMETISANLANRNSLYDAKGNFSPFRRRIAMFAPGDPASGKAGGVHVASIAIDKSPFRKVYDPDHPNADKDGYLNMPNVSPEVEMVNSIDAMRAYEANITMAEATKSMLQSSLRLLA